MNFVNRNVMLSVGIDNITNNRDVKVLLQFFNFFCAQEAEE